MAALFDVDLRTTETADEEIAEPLLCAFQIMGRIHGPKNVVIRNLAIKRGRKALKSFLADG